MNWVDVNSSLPEEDYCYVLVTKGILGGNPDHLTVDKSFFIKDREHAKKEHTQYSRKWQGKHSVHFSACESGYTIIAWCELPEPYKGESEEKHSE